MGTPYFILASGQSNMYANGAGVPFSWSPNARAKVWNNVRDNDASVGTAYNALSPSLVDISLRYASNVAAADPNKDVYLANYSRGGLPILHWVGGGVFTLGGSGAGGFSLNAAPNAATVLTMSPVDAFGIKRYYYVHVPVAGEKVFIKQGANVYEYTITAPTVWNETTATVNISYVSGSGGLTPGTAMIEFQPRLLRAIENSVPAALAAAGKSAIDVFLWWQGESDSEDNTRYEVDFEFMLSYLGAKPWWSPETKVIICAMNSTANNGLPEADAFNARLAALAAVNPSKRKFANTPANVPANRWTDIYHMSAQGYADAGDYIINSVYTPPMTNPGGGDPGGGGGSSITSMAVGAMTVVMDVRTNGNHGLLSDGGTAYGLWLDGPPHPYRDNLGNKYITLSHSENYRFLVDDWNNGNTWALQGTILEGARNTLGSAYNNRNWIFAVWSTGATAYCLIHHEWYVSNKTIDGIPGFNNWNYVAGIGHNRQWVNAISWGKSTDGGRNFTTSTATNSSRLVLIPEPWDVQQKNPHFGFFHPSNIAKEGNYFYAAVDHRSLNAAGTACNCGVSLIRTTDISAPTGWQFWDGSAWVTVNHNSYQGNLSSQYPHRFFPLENHDYYNNANYDSHMGQCLRYHTPSGQWLMFGYTGTGASVLGYSKTTTLANPQFTTIYPINTQVPQDFNSSAARQMTIFDEAATDLNYQNIGNSCTIMVTGGAGAEGESVLYSYAKILKGVLTINVTSVNPPTYSISASTGSTSEGLSVTFTVTTTNVANGTVLYWTNAGTTNGADFTDGLNSGSVTINGNAASFTRTLVNDAVTEDAETIVMQLRTGSAGGTVVATAPTVTVAGDIIEASNVMRVRSAANSAWITATGDNTKIRNADNTGWIAASSMNFKLRNSANTGWISPIPASAEATYSISASSTTVNEGVTVTFTVTTTNVGSATLFWTNAGTTSGPDFSDGAMSGSVAITGNAGSFARTILSDALTEGGETIVMQLRTGSTSGPVVATSQVVTVTDTSVSGPTFAFSPSVTAVNEGESVNFTVTATDFGNGTLYWTNAGTTAGTDFTDNLNSGSVTISNNTGAISRTLVNDLQAEGGETIVMQLRTGSTSGPVVATATSVAVADSSVPSYTPPNPYTLTLARNDLDFIYATDVPHNGGTTINLRFAIDFDDFFTAGGDHIPFVLNAVLTDPHTNHCGPIIRNGQKMWSYGRGFVIAAGTNQIFSEHWNGTTSPGVALIPKIGGANFNPAVNKKVMVWVIAGLRTGSNANTMYIYIRDMSYSLLFHGSIDWGWDAQATYKAAIAGFALGFQSPNDNGCVERTGSGSAPNASATVTEIEHWMSP